MQGTNRKKSAKQVVFCMKRFISIVLIMSLCLSSFLFIVDAKTSYLDCALEFSSGLDDGGEYYYFRFVKEVIDVGDDFEVEVVGKNVSASEDKNICAVIPTELIYVEHGDLLEIILMDKDSFETHFPVDYIQSCTIKGLKFADQKTRDIIIEDSDEIDQGGNLWDVWSSMKRTGLYGEKELDEFYVSTGSKWKLNVSDAQHMTDMYLADHAVFYATGIEMTRQGDTYTFPTPGDGTVTLELAGCISRTWNLHVVDKAEMKKEMLEGMREQGFFKMVFAIANSLSRVTGIFAIPTMIITIPIAFVYVLYSYCQIIFA